MGKLSLQFSKQERKREAASSEAINAQRCLVCRRIIVIYVIPKAFKHNVVHINDYFRHCKYGYYFFARRIPITYPLSGLKRYLCKQQAKQRQNSSKATGREREVGREGEREYKVLRGTIHLHSGRHQQECIMDLINKCGASAPHLGPTNIVNLSLITL